MKNLKKSITCILLAISIQCIRAMHNQMHDQYLASSGKNGEIKVWDMTKDEHQEPLTFTNENEVAFVAFSPHEKHILLSAVKNIIKIWNIKTRTLIKTLKNKNGAVWLLTWSPRHKDIVASGSKKSVAIWDIETGKKIKNLTHKGCVWSLAFANNSNSALLAAGYNDKIIIWNVLTGEALKTLSRTSCVYSLSFSPHEKNILVSSEYDGKIIIWNISKEKGKEQIRILEDPANNDTGTIMISSHDKNIIASAGKLKVAIWDTSRNAGKEKIKTLSYRNNVNMWSLDFNPHNKNIVALGQDTGTIKICDISKQEGKELIKTFNHGDWVYNVAFSPIISKFEDPDEPERIEYMANNNIAKKEFLIKIKQSETIRIPKIFCFN